MNKFTSNQISSLVEPRTKGLRFYTKNRNYALNGCVLTYVICGYIYSLVGLTSQHWEDNIFAIFLLVHTLTMASFFVHEFIHHNIFSNQKLNRIFGTVMLFLTGTCYSRFKNLAPHHIAHHIHGADFSPFYPFSLSDFLRSLPRSILKLIVALEWLFIPIVALTIRWMIAIAPFLASNRQDDRWRNATLLILRGTLFTGLGFLSLRAVFFYFIAYSMWLNILQFTEGFQHTYAAYQIHGEVPKYQLKEDEANTYSIQMPYGFGWIGSILFLNNHHHNAHHRLMSCPWYLLPKLNAEIYGKDSLATFPFFKLLKNYCRYRTRRLFDGQGIVKRSSTTIGSDQFFGATGMSFMLLRQPFDWLNTDSWLQHNQV